MSRDGRYSAKRQDAGAHMSRMDGQKIAPAFSALPPSMAVVCRSAMDGKERCAHSGKIFSQRRRVRKEMIVFLSVLRVSAREKILSFISANTVDILSS